MFEKTCENVVLQKPKGKAMSAYTEKGVWSKKILSVFNQKGCEIYYVFKHSQL